MLIKTPNSQDVILVFFYFFESFEKKIPEMREDFRE